MSSEAQSDKALSCHLLPLRTPQLRQKTQGRNFLLPDKVKSMILSRQINNFYQSPFLSNPSKLQKRTKPETVLAPRKAAVDRRKVAIRGCSEPEGEKKTERRTFLTLEEAGLVEMSGLDTHERFLCRLTISSLNLLRVISEQEGCPIEELNAGRICDWFFKDKLKREQNIGSAVLQWDDSGFQI